MSITGYKPFHWPARVYIEDTDAGGIVFYVNYLKFMERARTELLRSIGFEHYIRSEEDFMFVVADAQIRYRKPALMDDQIFITAQVVEMTRATVLFKQTVERDGDILAEGHIKIACVTRSSMKPRAHPERFTRLLNLHYGIQE